MRIKFLLFFTFFISLVLAQSVTTQTFTTSGSFTVPCGVTSLTVQCWGAGGGGGGGNGSNKDGGGGGGGGGCAIYDGITVNGGATYNYTVGLGGTGGAQGSSGTAGGFTQIIIGATTIKGFGGGFGVRAASGAGGVGGTATGGTTNFNGGNGANGLSGTGSGGGGEGASSTGSGNPASNEIGGSGNSGGGDGGSGKTTRNGNGNLGGSPGGGGGGGNGTGTGADGGGGQLIIIYATPPTADAGVDQTQCNSSTFTINANTISGFTGAWTCVTGCTGITINNSTSASTTVTGITANTSTTLQWTLTNTISGCTLTDNVVLTNNAVCPPSNDNCSSAISFPAIPTDGSCSNLNNQSTAGASNSNVTPSGSCTFNSGTPDDDVWFKFVATTTTHILTATWVSGNTDIYWQIFSGSCGSTMNSILCTDVNSGGTVTGLTIGQTYYVRLYTWSSTGATTQNICISSPPPPPTNDNCNNAIPFPTIPTNGTCSNLNNQYTSSATNSNVNPNGFCTSNSGTPDDDVWFSFVATTTSHILSATYVSGNTDIYWQVFSGSCASTMNTLLCTDNDAGGTITGLTIGQTYYVRLYTWSSSGSTTQNICLSAPPPPPTNDNCAGATAFPVIPTNGTCANLLNQSTNAATNSNVTPSGACTTNPVTPDDDVWFSFVATTTTHILSSTWVSGNTDIYWQVFSGSCNSTMNSLLCTDNDAGGTISGLTIGQTYYIRLYTWSTLVTTTQNLCISSPPPPPINDECSGATQVTVNDSPNTCTLQTEGTIAGATSSGVALGSCFGTADDDVWFSFIANSNSINITLNNVTGSTTDLYHSVYSGNCGTLGTALICSDPNSSTLNGLTIGNTYFVRVYSYTSTSGQNTTFNVCISPTPPPPTNITCDLVAPFCSGSPYVFQAQEGGADAPVGPNYGCLSTKPNPTWFYLEIDISGTISIDLTAGSDIDFAIWGPYANLTAAKAACSSFPAPLDCSYSSSNTEQINISNAQTGEVYVVLVTNYADVIQNITLNQAPDATATTNCNILLPIELLFFNAKKINKKLIEITWSTASEANNDFFTLERSENGLNFENLIIIDGAGNSNQILDYHTYDYNPFDKVTYYRLKQTDFNDEYSYSTVIAIYGDFDKNEINNIHPNPTSGNLNFDVKLIQDSKISIEVYDFLGRIILTEIKNLKSGKSSENIVTENLAKGIYILKIKIENSDFEFVKKIIKN